MYANKFKKLSFKNCIFVVHHSLDNEKYQK